MTYRAYATGEKTPKPKSIKKKADSESSPKTKPTQASKGKRIKTSAKGDKAAKIKQSTTRSKGLTMLSEVALSEADQIKLANKRSKKEFHNSHASGSGDGVDIQTKVPDEQQHTVSSTNEGASDKPEVPDVPEYRLESKEESWTFSQGDDDEENDEHDNEDDNDEHDSENDNDDEDDDQENVSGEPESDNDRDDFVHPNLSTYKADDQEEEKEDEKANDDDEVSSREQEYEEDEELYVDLNLNLDRRDAEMTDAQTNQETEEVHVTLTTEPPVVQQQRSSVSSDLVSKFINPSPDTGIDSILNPNVQSDIPVNVSIFATTETPSSDTTIPQPPIPIIQSQQQTHDSTTTTTIPTTTLPEIPNFASLFGFERRVEKYVTEFLGAKVLARSSNQPQTSYAAAASLSKLELKKILIDKIEKNKSMNKLDIQKNLYNTLIDLYNSDTDLFASNGDVVTLKRGHDDQDKDEEPFAGSNRGTTRRRSGKEESSKEATQKESKSTSSSKGASRSQPKSSGKSAQAEEHGPRNKTKTIDDRPPQSWMTQLAQVSGTQSSFNEFLATPIDFSAFIMNQLKLNNLTQDVLTSLTYDLMKGTCKSVVELEYHLEEVFKATNDRLDWHNLEGRLHPYDLSKPLPLIQNA
ncbi:hypothetical protein Tco_1225074 [Tanacetum coccineum]